MIYFDLIGEKKMSGRCLALRSPPTAVRLFLGGDVMLGRGIDQILKHPGDAQLYEGFMTSAEGYVTLAERRCVYRKGARTREG